MFVYNIHPLSFVKTISNFHQDLMKWLNSKLRCTEQCFIVLINGFMSPNAIQIHLISFSVLVSCRTRFEIQLTLILILFSRQQKLVYFINLLR